jgi:protein O-mannosyl-transferase
MAVALLLVLTLAAYSDSFRAGLTYDSYHIVKNDTRIRAVSAENTRLIFTQDYWYTVAPSGLFRPLTTFSYQFNYAVLGNGERPAGYHAVNFLLHALNIALVYWLGLLILEAAGPALTMAALWAVHPVLTESVTNIVGRADLLSAFGVLAGLLCYVRSGRAAGWGKAAWLLGGAAAAAIGIFAKENTIVLLAVAPLYEVARGGQAGLRGGWRRRVPGYAALAAPMVVYLEIRHQALSRLRAVVIAFSDNNLVDADFWTARLTAVKVIGKYLWLLVWPARLSCDYSYSQVPLVGWRFDNLEDWKTIFALGVCAMLGVLAWACFRRARPVFFFILFFFIALAPTANLLMIIGSVMAERFLYLPAIGFAGCLAWAGWALYQRAHARWPGARIVAVAAVALLCAGYAVRTFARNRDWRDEYSLWASSAQAAPNSYKTHFDFGGELMRLPGGAGLDRAAAEFERSMAIMEAEPEAHRVPEVYAAAGMCYRMKGDVLEQSVGRQPGYDPHQNIWYQKSLDVLLRGERADHLWAEATRRANRAIGKFIGPAAFPSLYLTLGRLYVRLGEPENALAALDYGRRVKPLPDFFEDMSGVYLGQKDPHRAVTVLMEGLVCDLTQVRLAAEVAQLYRQTAPASCALTGSGLNLECPLVHDDLCNASRNLTRMFTEMQWREQVVNTARTAVGSLGCPAEMFR